MTDGVRPSVLFSCDAHLAALKSQLAQAGMNVISVEPVPARMQRTRCPDWTMRDPHWATLMLRAAPAPAAAPEAPVAAPESVAVLSCDTHVAALRKRLTQSGLTVTSVEPVPPQMSASRCSDWTTRDPHTAALVVRADPTAQPTPEAAPAEASPPAAETAVEAEPPAPAPAEPEIAVPVTAEPVVEATPAPPEAPPAAPPVGVPPEVSPAPAAGAAAPVGLTTEQRTAVSEFVRFARGRAQDAHGRAHDPTSPSAVRSALDQLNTALSGAPVPGPRDAEITALRAENSDLKEAARRAGEQIASIKTQVEGMRKPPAAAPSPPAAAKRKGFWQRLRGG